MNRHRMLPMHAFISGSALSRPSVQDSRYPSRSSVGPPVSTPLGSEVTEWSKSFLSPSGYLPSSKRDRSHPFLVVWWLDGGSWHSSSMEANVGVEAYVGEAPSSPIGVGRSSTAFQRDGRGGSSLKTSQLCTPSCRMHHGWFRREVFGIGVIHVFFVSNSSDVRHLRYVPLGFDREG